MKKRLIIDSDIWASAEAYVRAQIEILEAHGDRVIEGFNFEETVYKVAEYPQKIRNLKKAPVHN